jgi:hypothetical protein
MATATGRKWPVITSDARRLLKFWPEAAFPNRESVLSTRSGNSQLGNADGQERPVDRSLLLLCLCGLLLKLDQLGGQISRTKLLNGFLQVSAGLHFGLCLV